MSSVEELGTALMCLEGANQALSRLIQDDVDDTLTKAATASRSHIEHEVDKLQALSNWRREVER